MIFVSKLMIFVSKLMIWHHLQVHLAYVQAAAHREAELLVVFSSYDEDGDGNLGLPEFKKIVHEMDSGKAQTVGLHSTYVTGEK